MTVENMVEGTEVKEANVVKYVEGMDFDFAGFDVSRDEMSVAQFIDRLNIFKFNDPIQRNAVWSVEKKSLLIVSILEEVSIGEFMTQILRNNKKKIRNVLDGKQRLTTIRDFVKNRFTLKDALVQSFDSDGESILLDISGLSFEELPQEYQNRILALILNIKSYDDIDDALKSQLFQRWNNGEALKPSQLRKSKMSYELLFAIAELKQLEVFNAGFSNSAVNNDTHSDMLLKALCVLKTDNNTALDNKTINKFLDENAFSNEHIQELNSLGEYLNEVYTLLDEKAVKKSFGASKTTTLIYIARKAVEEKVSTTDFADWVHALFVRDYKRSGYASSSGTTKLDSVRKRNLTALAHYNQYFSAEPVEQIV